LLNFEEFVNFDERGDNQGSQKLESELEFLEKTDI